ncbi:unnamed protein product, partial [Chrysoparadoxa australica]
MIPAAITVQSHWRGYVVRKAKALLAQKKRDWLALRSQEDLTRQTLGYRVRNVFGIAPGLKSDTNRESVLKQYPVWRREVVSNIVHGQWVEAAKMAREQEFFKKRLRKHGNAQAKKLLRLAEKARKSREVVHSRVQELREASLQATKEYREKRGDVQAPEEEKTAALEASRAAKQLLQDAQEQLKEATDEEAKAEAQLAGVVGQRRLKKTVDAALSEGVLMPFRLAMEEGSDRALLPFDFPMARVRGSLHTSRRVRFSMPAESDKVGGGRDLGIFCLKGIGLGSSQRVEEGKSLMYPVLELARDFIGDGGDLQGVECYRIPVRGELSEAFLLCKEMARGLFVWQLAVKAAIVCTAMWRRSLEARQDKYDDDSREFARLARWVEYCRKRERRLMQRRNRLFDQARGFDLKGRASRYKNKLLGAVYNAREEAAAAKALLAQAGESREMTAFRRWHEAEDRDKVKVVLKSGSRAQERTEDLLTIEVDMDTPVWVLREFVRRIGGPVLNARGIGERFLMETAKGTTLTRLKEKDEKNITMSMIHDTIDHDTKQVQSMLFLREEKIQAKRGSLLDDAAAAAEKELIPEADFWVEGAETGEKEGMAGIQEEEEEREAGAEAMGGA